MTPLPNIPKQTPTDILKIVLFGPESTGKTTLSRQLSAYYNTQWVPEFARAYLQKKFDEAQTICEVSDILPIAIGQIKSENELLKEVDKILICDTDILETKVYSEIFYGFVPNQLEEAIQQSTYDLYLLTYIDTPWVADDLRDRPNKRKEMFEQFENALITHKKKYIIMKGKEEIRLQKAVEEIDKLLS